ncbi:hypothetical protein E3N88_00493 [Mikania micrantha]|uniref:Uncharacterized protein n=1 Tax=Mikania micrantha TaxID=192012 RepID=A0A5N6PZP0_9ASTR|nr:hypothetical protein E3N88_00493 [Mikania micrantha]
MVKTKRKTYSSSNMRRLWTASMPESSPMAVVTVAEDRRGRMRSEKKEIRDVGRKDLGEKRFNCNEEAEECEESVMAMDFMGENFSILSRF